MPDGGLLEDGSVETVGSKIMVSVGWGELEGRLEGPEDGVDVVGMSVMDGREETEGDTDGKFVADGIMETLGNGMGDGRLEGRLETEGDIVGLPDAVRVGVTDSIKDGTGVG